MLASRERRDTSIALIQSRSLTSLQQRLFKTGGRLIRHARYFVLQLAESYLTGSLFLRMLHRIERLDPGGSVSGVGGQGSRRRGQQGRNPEKAPV